MQGTARARWAAWHTFVPVVFLTGAVQSLFTPLAMAMVVAMMASYLLSRTLIPTVVRYLLHSEVQM
jgi:Cu/Ag efflux pump CusA